MPVRSLRDIYKPAWYTTEGGVSLKYFAETMADIDHRPPYQRGSVWTTEQREAFMGHLLQGGEVLPIIVQRVPDMGGGEILDGKQRTEAIEAWCANKVGARLTTGELVYRRDIDGPDRKWDGSLNMISMLVRYINLPWAERVAFYVRYNQAGTPHTREQLLAASAAREPKD